MSASVDLIVRGGLVVSDGATHHVDLAVRDGRVTAWLDPAAQVEAREVIDVQDRIVLPGAVDAHVHMREPGLVHKEGFATGSRAAAAGGVTSMLVMPTDDPLTVTPQDFEAKLGLAEGQCHIDFGLQAAASETRHVADLAGLGAVSFEIFLGDFPPLVAGDNGALLGLLETIAANGAVAGITPADDGVIEDALDRERDNSDALAFSRSRPPASETFGVARACAAARLSGARVHLRQISSIPSIEVLAAMRPLCPALSAEAMVHNLLLTEDDTRRLGPFAKVLPPLRMAADAEELWRAIDDGTIDIVASDHAPHLPEEKEAGRGDVWKAPGGFPGVQTLLPLMIDTVAQGRLTWEALVALCSERPARLFGLHPRKGTLRVGADADMVLVDPARETTIENGAQLSKARITPFSGRIVRGALVRTVLRGSTVMQDGEVVGKPAGQPLTSRAS